MTYSNSTYTTISGPDGRVVSGYSEGYLYAVAEAIALDVDPQTSPEGDYAVNSEHTYYRERREPQDGCYPSGICTAALRESAPGARFRRASLNPFAPQFFFVVRYYTYFVFPIRIVAIAYRWANTSLGCTSDPNRP